MADRVAIFGIGLVTAGGQNVGDTWNALMHGLDTRSLRLCPDGVERAVHVVGTYGDNLFPMALKATEEATMPFGTDCIDTVCIGSSSDTVAYREVRAPGDDLFIIDKVAGLLEKPAKYQVGNACAASSTAIILAMDLIRSGKAKVVLAGGVDEVTFSSIAGFNAWRVYGERCLPFDKARKGLVLADGAGFVLLAREQTFAKPLAYLTGAGLYCDAKNTSGMDSSAVREALELSLVDAGVPRVDALIAHGTGTVMNDAAESAAIAAHWADWEWQPMVLSYKGVLGHPQGASGAVGVCLAVNALKRQQVWGTTPRDRIDPRLEVSDSITQRSGPMSLRRVAVLSHGSWGVYSSLIVEAV